MSSVWDLTLRRGPLSLFERTGDRLPGNPVGLASAIESGKPGLSTAMQRASPPESLDG